MKAALDTITMEKDKAVVYVHILDDEDKIVGTFSAYYTDKASFETEVKAQIAAVENKKQEKIALVRDEVLDVFAKITIQKE